MRSLSCLPRIHIRPKGYCRHESSSLPADDAFPNIGKENAAAERPAASGARATRQQKEYQREVRRTSIVQLCIHNRIHRQEQLRQLGCPAAKRSLSRPVRQPRASRQIRPVRKWPPPRNDRRAVSPHRTRPPCPPLLLPPQTTPPLP